VLTRSRRDSLTGVAGCHASGCRAAGRNGLEIIGNVHQLVPECCIVILTVFEDEAKISKAISAGGSGYPLKTSHAETVAEAIIKASQGGSPMSPKVATSAVAMLPS